MYNAEDCRCRANAEREDDKRDGGETRRKAQRSDPVSQITRE
jgi:hypothetical protein